MIFLGLERPVEYQRLLVFDPTMALMVFNAQRDYFNAVYNDYQLGLSDLKEFNKEFGTFDSPIIADNDNYYNLTMGGIKKMFDDANASGIDLLRSPEGRRMVLQYINTRPYGDLAKLRQSSESAKLYLKAKNDLISKGLYNPDLENFRLNGKSLENWDTLKSGLMWDETSPLEYKDLNKYTTHIFDALDDSYIETKDHYDWYGVTLDDMYKALTPDTLGGLVNTELGRFHLNNARNDLIAQGNLNPTDAEVMDQFRKNIVAANSEKTHRNRKLNEMWKMQQENAARRASAVGQRHQKETIAYDSAEGLFYRGLIKSGGTSHYGDIERAVEDGRDNIVHRQIALLKQTLLHKMNTTSATNYILDNLSIEEAPGNFSRYAQIPLTNGVMPIDKHWANRFFSDESVVSHMYGVTYGTHEGGTGKLIKQSKKYTDRSLITGKVAIPTTKVRTAFTLRANGEYAIRQFWQMEIGKVGDDGNFVGEGKYMEFELPTSRKATNNMPDYNKWKKMNAEDKDVIIRPSLSEDPNTLGWKNTGSMQVNMYEHVPTSLGFPGTSNNEAYETP